MRLAKTVLTAVIITGIFWSPAASEILEDLVLNYSDFNYVNSIAVGFEYVYFGTSNGITRYNINDQEWDDPLNGVPGLRGSTIYEIRVSRDDENIWVRTEFGIYKYTNVFERWDQVESFPADENPFGTHMQPDFDYFPPDDYLYVNDGKLVDYNGNGYPLTDIVSDGWGNLWIGTGGLGAIHANESSRRMELLDFGLLQADVTSIFLDNGILWIGGLDIGSYRSGLTRFDWRNNEFEFVETGTLPLPIYEDVNCVFGTPRYIFYGTQNGVVRYDKKKEEIDRSLYNISALPGREVYSLYAYGDSLFIGTNYGLAMVDISPDTTSSELATILTPQQVYSLLAIDGFLWIGTSSGAYRMNLYTGELGQLNSDNYASYGEIRDIEKYGDMIWLATQDEIVAINSKTAASETYTETIAHGGARALAVTDSLVAAGTRDGLLLIWTGRKPRSVLYTEADGLISNDVRDVLIDGEYLWIGTDKGLTRFWLDSPSVF